MKIDKQDCTGCSACEQRCPKQCISMITDAEGFRYPKINGDECISCRMCEKACPVLSPLSPSSECTEAYAAYNKDEVIRMQSSSGGVFSVLADHLLRKGGIVFGASFTDGFEVSHVGIESVGDLGKLRGSKYLQSNIGDTYRSVKANLEKGRDVLFSGTPCQVEGLLSFLGKPYRNLITQDIICHGVPSPYVWRKYLSFREKKASSEAKSVSFRNKEESWKHYSVQVRFAGRDPYSCPYTSDPYMTAFLKNICLRPSCYRCRFKKENRKSDFTLADFWGIEDVCPEMDDDRGTSLVLVNSGKGRALFSEISEELKYCSVDFVQAIRRNSAFLKSVPRPEVRERFLKKVSDRNFDKLAEAAVS